MPGRKPTGKKNGRPEIVWDDAKYKEFEKLCEIHCTLQEVLGWFRIDDMTLDQLLHKKYGMGFSEIFPVFAANGKISLRRQLFLAAFGHSVNVETEDDTGKKKVTVQKIPPDFRAMKWLSTQHIGMSERIAQKIEVEERRVVTVDLSWSDESSGNQLADKDAEKDATPKKV